MLSKKSFAVMRKEYLNFDKQRERLIKKSRVVLKLSKQIIYAVHRDDIETAENLVKNIKKELVELNIIAKQNPKLACSGSFKIAGGEYTEALLYHNFVKNKKIPFHEELKVSIEQYLLGLCDLTGELVRKAIFLAGKGRIEQIPQIKDIVDEIHGELLKFDIRENELRRKFDSVKYNLKKLEELVLELKLKDKL